MLPEKQVPQDKLNLNVGVYSYKTRFCSGLDSSANPSKQVYLCRLFQTELIIQGLAQYLAAPSFSHCFDDPHGTLREQ